MTPTLTPTPISGSAVPVVFHAGALQRLPEYVRGFAASRVLLVSDEGVRAAGHVDRAVRALCQASIVVRIFDQVIENPTARTVSQGAILAREVKPDLIIGLGGGSSMDTAKGINFIHTNGGVMADYQGRNKARKPMLPLIAIPTTAGTGSEAQAYALISDPETHVKMACGDDKALARLAILDPDLIATVPPRVAAAVAVDAVSHAVESAGCNRRNDISRRFSREAWRLLDRSFGAHISGSPQADMLLGAHLAGCAIENAMLGAAHATANPLTAKFEITHGVAVGLMLPHVVRFNAADGGNPYADLNPSAADLADRLERMLQLAAMPARLRDLKIPRPALADLAALAAAQWTARFNPRPVAAAQLQRIYESAW
jgi:alcohol dehydrogenase